MANDWFFTLNGQQQPAPTSSEELRKLASAGQLQPTDMVWRAGMANWAQASSTKGPSGKPDSPSANASRPPSDARPKERPRREPRSSEPARKGPPDKGGLLALHPLLVLLISACTCGLFGLVYA